MTAQAAAGRHDSGAVCQRPWQLPPAAPPWPTSAAASRWPQQLHPLPRMPAPGMPALPLLPRTPRRWQPAALRHCQGLVEAGLRPCGPRQVAWLPCPTCCPALPCISQQQQQPGQVQCRARTRWLGRGGRCWPPSRTCARSLPRLTCMAARPRAAAQPEPRRLALHSRPFPDAACRSILQGTVFNPALHPFLNKPPTSLADDRPPPTPRTAPTLPAALPRIPL